ncbi:Serine/threonine exchanger SteT [Myxococcaceae bacterium]|nr:Serine/threonine exchanger SteT [Myxococcaceae bacterium]
MESAPDRHPRDRLRRELSLTDATLLVVASVIGSGIFLTPGAIAERIPDPGWILLVWLVGGLLSLAGALANAELGAMFPHAGGDYVYLREAFHPGAGFVMGWISFLAIFTGTVATLAAGFADSIAAFVPLGDGGRLGVAIGITVAASALNYVGVRSSARFNNATSAIKIAVLVAFGVLAWVAGEGSVSHFGMRPPGEGPSLTGFGLALSPVLFSYLGWNATVYVASEILEPRRNVPRSLFLGLALCIAVYLVVNLAYLYAIPVSEMRGTENVGEEAARALFGDRSGTLLALFVLASILGTLNATILVGPRIAYAMALDGRFFGGVDRVHEVHGTPHVAIVVQGIVAVAILLVLRTFPSILDFTTFAIVLATMADTAALYALRWRQPERERPYRALGYPIVPAFYLVANAAIAGVLLHGNPRESGICLLVMASGVPFYLWFSRRERGRGAHP